MLKFPKSFFCLLVVFLFLNSACSQAGSEEDTSEEEVSDDFRSYPVDIDISETKFIELIDHVELMKLEETDESLLSYAFRIIEVDDKIIFPGDGEGSVHTFTSQGEFLSRFNNSGEGPGQYGLISTLWTEGNAIVIYDGVKQTIRWYDAEGKHLDDLRLPERAAHVYPYTGGYALDMSFSQIQDSLKYNVLLMDKALNYQQKLIPYDLNVPFPVTSTVSTFDPYKDKITHKSPFADTVYFVGANGAVPFYHIDFGEKFLWSDRSLYQNGQVGMSAINEGKGVWLFKAHTGPNHIAFTYNTSFRDFGTMLIERKNGAHVKLDFSKNSEERYGFAIIGWSGDRLLVSLSSTDVADLLSELSEDQWQFREGTSLEEIESSENPVLVWVKLKNIKE